MVRFGFKVPSLRKRVSARASLKRYVRNNLGLKAPPGWGWLTNPRKAACNRACNQLGLFRITNSDKEVVL